MAEDHLDAVATLLADGGLAVDREVTFASLTLLRVGGPAAVHVELQARADLEVVARVVRATGVPWTVVGRGSNLLVADAGFPGVVLTLGRGLWGLDVRRHPGGGARVRVEAGMPLPALASTVAGEGLGGFAWGVGVPGNVGGAVKMNAGAHGGEMADHLVEVDLWRMTSATLEVWPVETLGLRYRSSRLPSDAVVVAATLDLPAADADEEKRELARIRDWRRDHQPLQRPNCGSVFTNPPGDAAGRLVEACGAKGWRVGGAAVSLRHANFVVTRPGATAADVHALLRLVARHVERETGVALHEEVQRLGSFDDVVVPDGPTSVDASEDEQ